MADETHEAKVAERKFLHDLATPIAVINGQLEILMSLDPDGPPLDPAIQNRLVKIQTSVMKVRTLLEQRRAVLIEQMKS